MGCFRSREAFLRISTSISWRMYFMHFHTDTPGHVFTLMDSPLGSVHHWGGWTPHGTRRVSGPATRRLTSRHTTESRHRGDTLTSGHIPKRAQARLALCRQSDSIPLPSTARQCVLPNHHIPSCVQRCRIHQPLSARTHSKTSQAPLALDGGRRHRRRSHTSAGGVHRRRPSASAS